MTSRLGLRYINATHSLQVRTCFLRDSYLLLFYLYLVVLIARAISFTDVLK
jgi:hypothetical protein